MVTKTGEGKDMKSIKDTFWLDGWDGKCHSGFYYRNNIGQSIEEFENDIEINSNNYCKGFLDVWKIFKIKLQDF